MSIAADFKAKLNARAPLLGCFVRTPHPMVIEILSGSGLDCICLDAEHGPWDRAALDVALLAARAGGLPALVRTPSGAPHHILNALDLGAAGVVAPHVRTQAEAESVVAASAYGAGGRGYSGGVRATGYAAPPIGEQLARARDETSVIVQVEDLDALPNVEAIAGVPGIDAVFVGRIDLTVALGETDPKAPRVLEAIEQITEQCLRRGRTVGMFTPDLTEVSGWRVAGASLFLLGSDHGFLKTGAARLRADAGLG